MKKLKVILVFILTLFSLTSCQMIEEKTSKIVYKERDVHGYRGVDTYYFVVLEDGKRIDMTIQEWIWLEVGDEYTYSSFTQESIATITYTIIGVAVGISVIFATISGVKQAIKDEEERKRLEKEGLYREQIEKEKEEAIKRNEEYKKMTVNERIKMIEEHIYNNNKGEK